MFSQGLDLHTSVPIQYEAHDNQPPTVGRVVGILYPISESGLSVEYVSTHEADGSTLVPSG